MIKPVSLRQMSSLGIIVTFAGTGVAGSSGDQGPATSAQLNNPSALTVDTTGTVFIADTSNYKIRKVIGVVFIEGYI